MMERVKSLSRSGVSTIDERTAVPPNPDRITRSARVVVHLGQDAPGRMDLPPLEVDEPIGSDQVLCASAEPAQAERPAQAQLAEQRRLACMRVHPSNGPRYLREVLSQCDAG